MKKTLAVVMVLFAIGCTSGEKSNDPGRTTAFVDSVNKQYYKDSSEVEEMSRHLRWSLAVHPYLKRKGYSKTMEQRYVDSFTLVQYGGNFPVWYPKMLHYRDSLLRL